MTEESSLEDAYDDRGAASKAADKADDVLTHRVARGLSGGTTGATILGLLTNPEATNEVIRTANDVAPEAGYAILGAAAASQVYNAAKDLGAGKVYDDIVRNEKDKDYEILE